MGAPKLNQRFKIPLQTEVQKYMKERKGWPDAFVIYYAERFWSFYQSNGWKVSGKAPMKDWKAAFNSQWQTLKFKEDIEIFNRLCPEQSTAKVFHIQTRKPVQNEPPAPKNELQQLEQVLAWYKSKPEKWNRENLQSWPHLDECYQLIKKYRLWDPTITKADIEKIKGESGDENYLKSYILYRTFEWYGDSGFTFSDTLNLRDANK